jgi:hypothetical protein
MRLLINSATKCLALTALALPMLLSGCAPTSGDEGDSVDKRTNNLSSAARATIASIAMDNVGGTACGTNSQGGHSFGSSCTGNGGQPEYWCSDFAKWVWAAAGADVGGLTAAAGSFYCYGQSNGTLSNTPTSAMPSCSTTRAAAGRITSPSSRR